MKIIFELNHPKHYYQFKYLIKMLENEGHHCLVLARNKDILLDLLKEEDIDYTLFGVHRKKLAGKIFSTFRILINYHKIIKKWNPDIIISKASFYGCFSARLHNKKSFIFPDSEIVTVTNRFVVPLCTNVITPNTFTRNFGKKHIRILGFFENCYLDPSVFQRHDSIISKYNLKKPYAVFRFVGWFANHDVNNNGLSIIDKENLINAVKQNMTPYISSEAELPKSLLKYKLPTPVSEIHSVLANADLYIGDSQTMATESALLGTPAIRSNSFVGANDMSNFIILESKYKLLFNMKNYSDVLKKAQELSKISQKKEWIKRKDQYFKEVGDSNLQIKNIILNNSHLND